MNHGAIQEVPYATCLRNLSLCHDLRKCFTDQGVKDIGEKKEKNWVALTWIDILQWPAQ